ncbi:galactose-specific lectin nattectin-like [Pempheris klunzingeri]|uniref:galactose-specific lectin nattectin-like n=1 Tax=Pempheris klunzingeri TaxID=3127111 RepID=UPI003980006F
MHCGCNAGCPRGWNGFAQKCYAFHRRERNWAAAERFCNHLGGNLASLHTIDEYNFIRGVILRQIGYHKSTWVGGHDAVREGVWLWSDGSLFDFTGWAYREPNNYKGREDCMEINFAGRDYVNDNRCYRRKSFVCVKSHC